MRWHPSGFSEYKRFYSAPVESSLRIRDNVTKQFVQLWDDVNVPGQSCDEFTLVIVRGLFGDWIPGHFAAPFKLLENKGFSVIVANSRAAGTIRQNGELIGRDLQKRLPQSSRLIFLCHSKGGLDTLAMLHRFPEMKSRTSGIVFCQTPRAACPVLESALLGAYAQTHHDQLGILRERIANGVISLLRARAACLDLTGLQLAETISHLDQVSLPCPLISVATWSVNPTAALDSQHRRMQQIQPGHAHDGLFPTESLIWPSGYQVLLPHVDHAQPTTGGIGFDHACFWLTLARLAIKKIKDEAMCDPCDEKTPNSKICRAPGLPEHQRNNAV